MPIEFIDGMEDTTSWSGSGFTRTPARNGMGLALATGFNYGYNQVTPLTKQQVIGFAYRPTEFRVPDHVIGGPNGFGAAFGGTYQTNVRHVVLCANTDGSITVYRTRFGGFDKTFPLGTTAVGVLSLGAWNYIEVKTILSDTAGEVTIRVNNSIRLSLVGINTIDNIYNDPTVAVLHGIYFGESGSCGAAIFDDVYASYGPDADFLGDIVVETLYPNGNGTYGEWRGNDGNSVDNYLLVDEAGPPNSSDFVRSSVPGQRDTYLMSNLANLTGNIRGVAHVSVGDRDTSGGAGCKIRGISRGSTDTKTDVLNLASTLTVNFDRVYPVNPETGNPWTVTEVNNLQGGLQYEDPSISVVSASDALRESFNNLNNWTFSGTGTGTITPAGFTNQGLALVNTVPPITIASTATEVGQSLGTNNAIPAPSGVVAGDLLLAFCSSDNAATAITASTGWTELSQTVITGNIQRMGIFARLADLGANDALALSGATEDYCAAILRIQNHGVASLATDIKLAATNSVAVGRIDPPLLDTGVNQRWFWLSAGCFDNSSDGNVSTGSTAYTESIDITSTFGATGTSLWVGYRSTINRAEDPGPMSNALRAWIGYTLAVPLVSQGVSAKYSIPAGLQSDWLTIGFHFNLLAIGATGVHSIFSLWSDSNTVEHLRMVHDPSVNALVIYSGTTLLSYFQLNLGVGNWRYYEVRVRMHDTAGSVELRIDGDLQIFNVNLDTRNGGTKVVYDTVRLNSGRPGATTFFDNVYVTTGAGALFKGDIRL